MSIAELFSPQKSYTNLNLNSITSPYSISHGKINTYSTLAPIILSVSDMINSFIYSTAIGTKAISLPSASSIALFLESLNISTLSLDQISFSFNVCTDINCIIDFTLGTGTTTPGGLSTFSVGGISKEYSIINYIPFGSSYKTFVLAGERSA